MLRMQLLGPIKSFVAGRQIRLPLQRSVALIAYLSFNQGPVSRGHLAAMLWPGVDEPQGRTRLRRLIYTIEDSVGGRLFLGEKDILLLDARQVETDAAMFMQFARAAVACEVLDDAVLAEAGQWFDQARQPLLQGISFASELFDDWLKATVIEHERLFSRVLEKLIDAYAQRNDVTRALDFAEALISQDLYRESSYVVMMQLHARHGQRSGVEATYVRCADVLRAEFGMRPGAKTELEYLRLTDGGVRSVAPRIAPAGIRFAQSRFGVIAYSILGTGSRTLVIAPGFVFQIEIALEYPPFRAFIEALASRFQIVLFDRRGVGLSERLEPSSTPFGMAGDIGAILDHAGIDRAWLFGSSEGGLGAIRFAIDQPARVEGLSLFGSLACGAATPDYPWALPAPAYDEWLKRIVAGWGGPVGLETFAPSMQNDPLLRAWWARLVRQAASPGTLKTILEGLRDTDMRAELNQIKVPTLVMHRRHDRAVRFEAGLHLAEHIPGALWRPFDGEDHFWWCGDSAPIVRDIVKFASG